MPTEFYAAAPPRVYPPGYDMQKLLNTLRCYSIAVFSTMTATMLRMEMEPLLNSKIPFGLFFISSMLTAWLAGTGPAILAAILSVFAAAHFIIPPHDSLLLSDPSDFFSLGIYLIVTLASILMFHQQAVQQRIAEESANENSRLNSELRDADRRKDEFLALLAHELRNPLTPIQTAMDLLELNTSQESNNRAMQTIRRQLAQLVRLVNDLLDASRYVHGKLQIRTVPFDLREAVEIAVETNRPELELKRHRLYVNMPDQPIMINGDLPRLAQAVANLLHNATKFTPREGNVRLTVVLDETVVRIRIDDDGIGIPEELKTQIFNLFSQVNSSKNRREGGLGIGLALVRELAHLHGGSVSVESEGLDRGSCFTMELPWLADVNPVESIEDAAVIATDVTDFANPQGNPRILLIDDNVDATQLLSILFELEGYEIRAANNGIDGIRLANEYLPDVILLDIGMPGMDGYEVARILRQHAQHRETPIIAVSGWDGEEYRRKSREAGIDLHVAKPFHPHELLQVINERLASATAAG